MCQIISGYFYVQDKLDSHNLELCSKILTHKKI